MPLFILLILMGTALAGPADLPLVNPVQGESDSYVLAYSPADPQVDEEAERRMLELLNEVRREHGLTEFALDRELAELAREHSLDMWERKYFAHENPDGLDPLERAEINDLEFEFVGENLALTKSVERAHEGLMLSDGHRRNILDPNFTRVGIGVVDGGIYGKMFTQEFAD